MLLVEIPLPEYRIDGPPDFLTIGRKIDRVIGTRFRGRRIALRGISADDHPHCSPEDLVATIRRTGTDRYDPGRRGVLHEFYAPYGIELHALPCTVTPEGRLVSSHCASESVSAECLSDFHAGALADRGHPVRLDLLLVYDLARLEGVAIDYGGDPEPEPSAFRFRDPARRAQALLGILRLLR